ncbi:hypothetical protein CYMTET_34522, partial [Cymbomonas tetramitiformis]
RFEEALWTHIRDFVRLGEENPALLVRVLQVVHSQEELDAYNARTGRDVPPKEYKQQSLKQIQFSVADRFKGLFQGLDGELNIPAVLEQADMIAGELTAVYDYASPCFPEHYQLFDAVVAHHNKHVHKFLGALGAKAKDMSNQDILDVVHWAAQYSEHLQALGVSEETSGLLPAAPLNAEAAVFSPEAGAESAADSGTSLPPGASPSTPHDDQGVMSLDALLAPWTFEHPSHSDVPDVAASRDPSAREGGGAGSGPEGDDGDIRGSHGGNHRSVDPQHRQGGPRVQAQGFFSCMRVRAPHELPQPRGKALCLPRPSRARRGRLALAARRLALAARCLALAAVSAPLSSCACGLEIRSRHALLSGNWARFRAVVNAELTLIAAWARALLRDGLSATCRDMPRGLLGAPANRAGQCQCYRRASAALLTPERPGHAPSGIPGRGSPGASAVQDPCVGASNRDAMQGHLAAV